MTITEWREKKLEDLASVDAEIRRNQDEKKRINKEYSETIKDLESIRDSILDKLSGETGQLFEDEPTNPDGPRIELDEDYDTAPEAPEPGTYLGEDQGEDIPPPEPPDDFDPEKFMGS